MISKKEAKKTERMRNLKVERIKEKVETKEKIRIQVENIVKYE